MILRCRVHRRDGIVDRSMRDILWDMAICWKKRSSHIFMDPQLGDVLFGIMHHGDAISPLLPENDSFSLSDERRLLRVEDTIQDFFSFSTIFSFLSVCVSIS